ncbi:MAG: hypothetical protein ABI960_00440 [Candidatus Eisenbacteria bacterium]
MDDGLLDVHVYDGMGDIALLAHFEAATAGTPDALESYRARKIRISADEAMPSNVDMETALPQHEFEIDVLPAAVRMIVGNGIALSIPVASAPDAPTFATPPLPADAKAGGDAEEPALSPV